MLIYTEKITPRLQYIADVFFDDCKLTTSAPEFYEARVPKINYSFKRFSGEEVHIVPQGLLSESDIKKQAVTISVWNELKVFFTTKGDIPFDILAASFYLLSRYEEYLPHKKDSYGRFAHEESLAYKHGFLHLPLVNLWKAHFFQWLQQRFPGYTVAREEFRFTPTYDIDIAFAEGRGWLRKLIQIVRREKTRINRRDVFDVYDWLDSLHTPYRLSPVYFFLLAKRWGKYDKNLSPKSKKLQRLIRKTAVEYTTGIHPSWQSYHDELALQEEIGYLRKITGEAVTNSRQHYIQFTLPHTYRKLVEAGITDDYSMGYGSINGFRASYTASFYWYDLMKDEKTALLLHPFCYMEANAHFEQRLTVEEAAKELQHYFNVVQQVQGELITIFHNHFLTEEPQWAPWREMYEAFISDNFKRHQVTFPFLPE